MKKFLKCFFISVLIVVLILFCGNCILLGLVSCDLTKTYPKENLVVYTGRNVISYIYQDKVEVTINYNDSEDSLRLRTRLGEESWTYDSIGILYGTFEKVGWYNDNLFILMDEKYYAFDIDGYQVPQLDEDGEPQKPDYELKEYSESEFKELYSDYESFDWYGH